MFKLIAEAALTILVVHRRQVERDRLAGLRRLVLDVYVCHLLYQPNVLPKAFLIRVFPFMDKAAYGRCAVRGCTVL